MDVYPQDLGRKNCEQVLRRRTQRWDSSEEPGRVRPRKRLSTRAVLSLVGLLLIFLFLTSFEPVFLLLVFLVGYLILGLTLDASSTVTRERRSVRHRRAAERECLSVRDVKRQKEATDDPLQRAFLELVQTALLMPTPSDITAERHVRAAIRALGSAIDGLPRHSPHLLPENPGALRAEADRLATQAQTEADGVIAASLERRAEAHARRAETVERAQTLLRRNEALRQEMVDQVETMRTSLVAAGINQDLESAELTGLAESVQRVAGEVSALSAAHAEVDDALHGGPRPTTQATRVRLRRYLDQIHSVQEGEQPPLFRR